MGNYAISKSMRVVTKLGVTFIEKLRFVRFILYPRRVPLDIVLRFNDARRSRVLPRRRFFAFLALHR